MSLSPHRKSGTPSRTGLKSTADQLQSSLVIQSHSVLFNDLGGFVQTSFLGMPGEDLDCLSGGCICVCMCCIGCTHNQWLYRFPLIARTKSNPLEFYASSQFLLLTLQWFSNSSHCKAKILFHTVGDNTIVALILETYVLLLFFPKKTQKQKRT